MTREELKNWARETGNVKLVAELVEGGYDIDSALEYVWDMKHLTNDEFRVKYFG